jgi:hypothetical protein
MDMYTGRLVLNGITDRDLVRVLEIKIKNETCLFFNPQSLQLVSTQPNGPNQTSVQAYNNAVFVWQDEDGLKAIYEIILALLGRKAQKEAA